MLRKSSRKRREVWKLPRTPLQGKQTKRKSFLLPGKPYSRNDFLFVCFPCKGVLGNFQTSLRFREDFRSIGFGPARLRDIYGVASFIQLQWDMLEIGCHGKGVPELFVLASFH